MVSLPSARREFTGFSEYFATDIAPYLEDREIERRQAVTNFAILLGATGVLCAALIFFGPFGPANNQVGVLLGFAGASGALWLLNRTRSDITHGLLDLVARKLRFSYRGTMERPSYYDKFRELKLLPSHNREDWEDEVTGAHDGADFVICESHLKMRKSNGKTSSTRTVFHGQLFVIDYPKRFLGTTVILRDRGMMNRFGRPGREFSNVGLASAEFEKAFEAWSTDQVEARDLLDPVVLERFQALEKLFGGKNLRAAFDGGKVYIAIETGDRLNMGTMFAPLGGGGRVETILKEFDMIFDLIDVLLARVDGRIDGAFSVDHVKKSA
ncbi:MAG: DUF3137 domain-containing protein [Parvularculaceae bacterium]|nr:DUF3137 domain-containing protein [Parvularculaceae bacterium]